MSILVHGVIRCYVIFSYNNFECGYAFAVLNDTQQTAINLKNKGFTPIKIDLFLKSLLAYTLFSLWPTYFVLAATDICKVASCVIASNQIAHKEITTTKSTNVLFYGDGFSFQYDHNNKIRIYFLNINHTILVETVRYRPSLDLINDKNNSNPGSSTTAVRYNNIYSKIDMVTYNKGNDLEYDFIVSPGGSPEQITINFAPLSPIVLENGDLLLRSRHRDLLQRKPIAYQTYNNHNKLIPARYRLNQDRSIGIELGNYDHHRQLIIDPLLSWTKRLNGSNQDKAKAMATDGLGNIYIAGETNSPDFPATADAIQKQLTSFQGSTGIFLTKMTADGKDIIYSTFLAGNGFDRLQAMAVDNLGNVYLTGHTNSKNLNLAPWPGVFVSKLDQNAARLMYSRTIGPISAMSHDIAVNEQGEAYIVGSTRAQMPLIAALDEQRGEDKSHEGFIVKLNANGNTLFSTYLGGSKNDVVSAIALDKSGQVYVTGFTESSDFPVNNALQSQFKGVQDVFVSKLNANGTHIDYSTYIGGKDLDHAADIAVDEAGRIYIVGHSFSDYPIVNATQSSSGLKGIDAFVSVIDPSGNLLLFSSYFGGSKSDFANSIALSSKGDIIFSGRTFSLNYPRLSPTQADLAGISDAFYTRLKAPNYSIEHSSYLGGKYKDEAMAILIGKNHAIYIAGTSESADFPGHSEDILPNHKDVFTFVSQFIPQDTSADLEAIFIHDDDSANTSASIQTVNLIVANNGVNNATFVKLTLNLPEQAKLVDITTPGFSCFESGGNRQLCVTNSIGAGQERHLSFNIDVATNSKATLSVATLAKERDPDMTNNMDQITVGMKMIDESIGTQKQLESAAPKSQNLNFTDYFCYSYP